MSAASPPGSAPKSMSSRLLTMKFMQRAAHSSPSASSTVSPDEPAPKRRRTDSASNPTKTDVDALTDRKAVEAAMASEEAKRQAALEKQAAEAGDTRWVLSFEDQKHLAPSPILALRVVQTGFASLDASPSSAKVEYDEEEEEDKPVMIGRRSYGRFNKVLEKQQNPSMEDSSESEDEEDDKLSGSDSDSDDPTSALIKSTRQEVSDRARADRKVNSRASKAESEETAKTRRKGLVNLNGMTSLSGKPDRQAQVPPGFTCYICGGPHFKRDCPKSKRSHFGGDDGPPRKTMRLQ
ncbi:uncharacterized protein L3040_000679 [Drepanopeziza brunnea f. sp. 'multigermtubi']|uniref:Zinc knuckle protein n=1 Tax=Marssonina brunnea f. sp. multigermtubi (strain MB_m1) TaxID=1072389 RepID=K1X8A2_MARBU|nr:zinc knuckle protein [Drepanopeziza brunnea f. sp. 'multigermtubi' MB_m1]EKD21281.1 zinc knuckle protein [Drepanopeziza brunnea f. sp. 'multigermtubi' MB_m1]KAJ5054405.1 hypothetical protein L3040_000679 [Drepanopeziza brunnea f. sp. 'multigermtubi']